MSDRIDVIEKLTLALDKQQKLISGLQFSLSDMVVIVKDLNKRVVIAETKLEAMKLNK